MLPEKFYNSMSLTDSSVAALPAKTKERIGSTFRIWGELALRPAECPEGYSSSVKRSLRPTLRLQGRHGAMNALSALASSNGVALGSVVATEEIAEKLLNLRFGDKLDEVRSFYDRIGRPVLFGRKAKKEIPKDYPPQDLPLFEEILLLPEALRPFLGRGQKSVKICLY
jgi:hypothetical protein